jgi:hypothetical protein
MLENARQQTISGNERLATLWISGLRGFWLVLDGHLGHARLANRMIYWLRRSSPTWLAQNDPQIRVLMKYPG